MGNTTPVGDASGSRSSVAQPAQATEPNPQEKKVQDKAPRAFAYLSKQLEDFEATWRDLQDRLANGNVTYRDAKKLKIIQKINLEALGKLNQMNEISGNQAPTIHPLSFHKYGTFCLDSSYLRSVHDMVLATFKALTLSKLSSNYDNKRENLQLWSETARLYYNGTVYAGIGDQTEEEVKTAQKGLMVLQGRYEAEDPSDPKSQVVQNAIKDCNIILITLKKKSDQKRDFPSLLKKLLKQPVKELKDICNLSYQLQFVLDEFVKQDDYKFLEDLGDALGAGGSNDHLALALACWVSLARDYFRSNPKHALEELKKQVFSDKPSKTFLNTFVLVRAMKDEILTQMHQELDASNLAMKAKDEKYNQEVVTTVLNVLTGVVGGPKNLFGYVTSVVKAYNEARELFDSQTKSTSNPSAN